MSWVLYHFNDILKVARLVKKDTSNYDIFNKRHRNVKITQDNDTLNSMALNIKT